MRKEYTLQVNGQNHILGRRTWMMGILNVTPDSFSDGGLFHSEEDAVTHGLRLADEGADIIDVGGESTRPGSDPISGAEELRRVMPVLSGLRKRTKVLISVDTVKSDVARAALEEGADIINDISALRSDPQMLYLAVEKRAPVILMHMKGTPKSMQVHPHYQNVLSEIESFFEERIRTATEKGLQHDRIIIDPGIGFGKRLEDNLALIRNLGFFESLGRPILVGLSRKSFIGKVLDSPPAERLEGTIASAVISVLQGVHILRVHDVAAVKKAVAVAEAIMDGTGHENIPVKKWEVKTEHVN